ncbi:LysR substrate-binding domain-containing protein [Aestuariispira insulae]|uniref:LysR family transcriptional regulator n=1 Tax=Aestuariispira insulae TaxID=1461337 RepID=A0A3D9HK47_9PROT|nr:LysR substrate-binding domain-containing protein [Aestuariispira insulae]RED49795.1 LysR family transcriptional regulator [Aestuariispira insulae]
MQNNTPLPLNALRAFEIAAKHLSFTRAAEELSVTQGAISRHVKGLEEYLQLPLFHRHHKTLELTEEGRYLLQGLTGAFEQIQETVRSLGNNRPELNIKSPPSLAARWLIPRLHRFEETHPEVLINLTTAWHFYDPDKEYFDAGIGYERAAGPEEYLAASLIKELICEEWMTPVCAPGYLEGKPPLQSPGDLNRHILLNCKGKRGFDDWTDWAEKLGVRPFNPRQIRQFDFLDIALNAAAAGQGIALGDIRFVQNDIEAGRLIIPLDAPPQKIGSYFMIRKRRANAHPGLVKFKDWMQEEARSDLPK